MSNKSMNALIQESLVKLASVRTNFTIVDIPYRARSFTLSDLNSKDIVFMPIIKTKFSPGETESIFNKWMKLDSYPKYKQHRLGDVDSGLLRKFNLGETQVDIEALVDPACYTDLSSCLKAYRPNSYVYVGVHEASERFESSERGVVFPTNSKFLCVALIKTGT